MRRKWLGSLMLYAAAGVLCLLLLVRVMGLRHAHLGVPFCNHGDALVSQVWVANALESGWYYHSDRLGAPYGMDLRDFPACEALHIAVMRALAPPLKNTYAVINVFFLLTFVLTTWAALAVFRHFGAGRLPALAGALLYAFLPFHFYRGEGHLFLAAYYLVPLQVLVALWVYLGRLAPAEGEGAGPARRRRLVALAVCLLVTGAGVYYAFFGTFFLLLAGLARSVREGRVRPLLGSLALAGTTCLGLGAATLPCHLYRLAEGTNPEVARRYTIEAEVYGLKITQLFLPIKEHRIDALSRLKQEYDSDPDRPVVNDFGSGLGVVGTLGCALLLGSLLFRSRAPGGSLLLPALGAFLVCGLLLATTGGLGSLFAFLVSPQIRCYDRMSIFLAFFALFAVVRALDRLAAWARGASWPLRLAAHGLCPLVLAGGLADQTAESFPFRPRYAELTAQHQALADFTGRIERALPPGAMVLQLPYCPFPEGGPRHLMYGYDHFRLAMHSRTLRWSHGAVKGRYGAAVLAALDPLPVERMLERAAALGYSGIHIDRRGFADGGRQLEGRLRDLLGGEPLESAGGRDLFFDLRDFAYRLRRRCGEDEWARRQYAARFPVVVFCGAGFQGEQRDDQHTWHCGGPQAEFQVVNPSGESRRVTLRFGARTILPAPARLEFSGPLLNTVIPIDGQSRASVLTVDVPPGRHVMSVVCDAEALPPRERPSAFVLEDLEAGEEDSGANGRAP
jgi:phosphoglycerol transferase